jgi:hypothetical protein
MKIGILTFHYSINYGGVLQSQALYSTLKNLGYDVQIIDFQPKEEKIQKLSIANLGLRKSDLRKVKSIQYRAILNRLYTFFKYNKKVVKKFKQFLSNNCEISPRVDESNIAEFLSNYDAIIVGSDQIWNPSQRKKAEYFLDYKNYNGKRISYAADSTNDQVDESEDVKLKSSLNRFNHISVRNEHSANFVNKIIHKHPIIVNDPTQLICYPIDDKFVIKEEYILIYKIGSDIEGGEDNIIEHLKSKYECKVYALVMPNTKYSVNKKVDKIIYDAGPLDWIEYIRNAKFVYTDSFHGCLFSLKFNKKFVAYYTEELRSSRFKYLAKKYDISDFIVNSVRDYFNKMSYAKTPNYTQINAQISIDNEISIDFLTKALR